VSDRSLRNVGWTVVVLLSIGCAAKDAREPSGAGGTAGEESPAGGAGGATGGNAGGAGMGGAGKGGAGQGGTAGDPPDAGLAGSGGNGRADAAAGVSVDTATPAPDARSNSGTGGSGTGGSGTGGSGTGGGGAGGMGPIGMVGMTACLNADGPGGLDTYALIDKVLGSNAVEHNPDMDHTPPFQHVQEQSDAEVGNHFVFFAHYPEDNDGAPGDDRSRIEIKVNGGAAAALKGLPGDTMTYTWRFKMSADMKFSNRFTHMHQIKSYGGNDGAPIITITGSGSGASENLRVDHWGDGTATTTLARVPTAGLKGIWLAVSETITVGDSGSIKIAIKKPDGSTVLEASRSGLDFWRQGDYVRGKWGIYRGKSDQLKVGEEPVRFANFGITKGSTPSSDCRGSR
jgi:hypothetical protein